MPMRSSTATSASVCVLPAPAPRPASDVSTSVAPSSIAAAEFATASDRLLCSCMPTATSDGSASRIAEIRRRTSSVRNAPAESTMKTAWLPASATIRACSAMPAGSSRCAVLRWLCASMPSSRASPRCWIPMSASVQTVEIRATDAPASRASSRSRLVPMPGRIATAMRARSTTAAAAESSSASECSGRPYWIELAPSPSPWPTATAHTPARSSTPAILST